MFLPPLRSLGAEQNAMTEASVTQQMLIASWQAARFGGQCQGGVNARMRMLAVQRRPTGNATTLHHSTQQHSLVWTAPRQMLRSGLLRLNTRC